MPFSYKVKRLLLVCIAILILAIAAGDGTKEIPKRQNPVNLGTPYPLVPAEIDRSVFERVVQAASTPTPTPSPAAPPKPLISAEAYLVANLETGKVSLEHNSYQVFPIASLSKLVTALVAMHKMKPDQPVIVTETMLSAYGDAGHLVLGEKFNLSDLYYPLLLESSNDVAEGIAQTYGYDAFIAEMNSFVKGLGMSATSFKDASGLNAGNSSNAQDLLKLARYIYNNEKDLLAITRRTTYGVASTTDHGLHTWQTINPFPYDPHFIGGKTGRTNEAKESMISMFMYQSHGKEYPVAIVVLRSEFSTREVDTSLLFERFMKAVDSGV